MSNKTNFETYLLINKKKFTLCVIDNVSFKTIYLEQIQFNDDYEEFSSERLNKFLEENIFKVEKILKNFIKNIYLILESEQFFSIKLSIKNNNNGNHLSSKSLLHPLKDLKNLCQSNFNDKKIIHILIENYLIDNKNYSSLPLNIKCNLFSLDVNFICLSNSLIYDIERVLKKYHILLNQILYANYIERFIDQNQTIFSTASKIKSGYNDNEVLIVDKSSKNQGFFEKFFNFFN